MRSVDPIQPLRAERMAQSPLGKVLGHLAKMAERQGQLHQVQNEVLTELAQSLAADRAMLRELLASGGRGEGPRGAGAATHIHVPKMGEADDAEAFLKTFQGVPEVSGRPCPEWAHIIGPLQRSAHGYRFVAQKDVVFSEL